MSSTAVVPARRLADAGLRRARRSRSRRGLPLRRRAASPSWSRQTSATRWPTTSSARRRRPAHHAKALVEVDERHVVGLARRAVRTVVVAYTVPRAVADPPRRRQRRRAAGRRTAVGVELVGELPPAAVLGADVRGRASTRRQRTLTGRCPSAPPAPALLARGPWQPGAVRAVWRDEAFDAPTAQDRGRRRRDPGARATAARRATTASPRGSSDFAVDRRRRLDARAPARALGAAPASTATHRVSVAALCVTRDAEGRWLAGRRAAWLSSWAGRWALGAGGAVDAGENPFDTLTRELHEEWARRAPSACRARRSCGCRTAMVMFVGQAWLPAGAEVAARRGARRPRVVARRHRRSGRTRPTSRCAGWRGCWRDTVTRADASSAASFAHSAIYLGAADRLARPGPARRSTFVFGWAHGLGWIAMCALCARVRLRPRLIDLRLAVAVAVLGAVGPFVGYASSCARTAAEPRRRRLAARRARVAPSSHGSRHRRSRSSPPGVGESVTEGTILEWHDQEGDHRGRRDPRRDLHRQGRCRGPSPATGTVVKIHVDGGRDVTVGQCWRRSRRTTARRRPPTNGHGATARAAAPAERGRPRPPARSSTSSPPPAASRSPRARSSSGP